MKADVSVEFYCFIDEDGMMKYVRKPADKQEGEPSQEELALAADLTALAQAEDASAAIEKALAESANGAEVKQPLTLTSLLDGIYTGKKLNGNATFRKEEMRDLLDAERQGLRPLFIISIK